MKVVVQSVRIGDVEGFCGAHKRPMTGAVCLSDDICWYSGSPSVSSTWDLPGNQVAEPECLGR